MSVDTKDETGSAQSAPRGQSILSRVLKPRPAKNPRSHEEIIADAEKTFSKTLVYLAK